MNNYLNKNYITNNYKISNYLLYDSNTKKFYNWFSKFSEEIVMLRMASPRNNNNLWFQVLTATTFYFLTNKENLNNKNK